MLLLTPDTKEELLSILNDSQQWRKDLKNYGVNNFPEQNRHLRVKKGELAEAFPKLIDKLQHVHFGNHPETGVYLSKLEVFCINWFFKKHRFDENKDFTLSEGLYKAFWSLISKTWNVPVPNSIKFKYNM